MLVSNPFTHELLLPTVYRLGPLLGIALVAILLRHHGRVDQIKQDVLFHRWRTWLVIAPTYTLAILSGSLATVLLVALISFQALREYAALVQLPQNYRLMLLAFGLIAAPVALIEHNALYILPALLLIIATLQPLTLGDMRNGVRHLAFATMGWAYIAWLLAHSITLYKWFAAGPGILLAVGPSVAISDVGAFVVGKLIGKHKMAPKVSPNKTYEGVAGNFLGAALGTLLMNFALPDGRTVLTLVALPTLIALGAILGDLFESVIKREFGVKDAGTCLPGFGGLLDRIDSFIIVLPLVYYFYSLTHGLGPARSM